MSTPPPTGGSSLRRTAAATLAVVAGVAVLLALVQQESGRCFFKTISLERSLERAQPSGELGYRVSLPKGYRDDQRVVEQARVLEDGVPLPLRIEKIKHVGKSGGGRYRVTSRVIYFSATDNSDPRSNGRRYEVKVPRGVRAVALWLPLILLGVAMTYLQRAGTPAVATGGARIPQWVEPLVVLAVSFAVMAYSLAHFSDYSDAWLVVKGVPFSDGMGWVELAKSLSEGRGFSGGFEAHRGGYPLLLGGFFSLVGGGSVLAAKIFNALMLSVGATAVYLLARSAFGRWVGILLLASLLTVARFDRLVVMTLTEPTGFALSAIGLHQLYRALLNPAVWRFSVAGVFLGLSNLVRPFTLLALPIFGGLILVIAWRQRWGWRRFATLGAAYVGGAMLVFGPWVLRQKLAWGVATLDLNSAVMLYGAAAPPGEGEKRALSARHYYESKEAGLDPGDHGARYRFYMGRYREVVAADPGDYFSFVAGQFVEFFSLPGFRDGHVRAALGVAFFLALAWLAWRRRFPPLVLVAGAWPLVGAGLALAPPIAVVGAAAAIAFCTHRGAGRIAVSLLLSTLCAAGVLNALVGNFALNRGTVFVEWIVILLVAAAFAGLARVAAGGGSREAADPDGRFSDRYPLAVLTLLAAGLLLVAFKALFAGKPDAAAWDVPVAVAERASAEVAKRSAAAGPAEDLFISRVRLGDYRYFIRAGEDVGHWARPFEVRASARTLAFPLTGYVVRSGMAKQVAVNLPGDQRKLDGRRDFLLVGVSNIDEDAPLGNGRLVVEALALIPYEAEQGSLDLAGGIYFSLPPDLGE